MTPARNATRKQKKCHRPTSKVSRWLFVSSSELRIRGFRSDLRCTGLPDSYHRSFPQRYKRYRFRLLDNTGVVGLSILRTRRTLVIPIKENNHSGNRLGRAVDPLSTIFEPLDAVHAACIFGYNTGVNIAALIGAPAYKTSTPFHTASEAIPRPIRLAAYIADL